MAETQLTKSVLLLDFHLLWQVDERVAFTYGPEDDPFFFYLSVTDWQDMGEPKQLTVTIQPGNLLNE